jgi:alkylated DNA repair protein alkB homolog 6
VDVFPSPPSASSLTTSAELGVSKAHSDLDRGLTKGIRVANAGMLVDERVRDVVQNGGRLERGTRVSLTCRDVEQTVGGSIQKLRIR